ncbi:Ig-like domain-containing protein [Shewanella sp. 3B26]|uniref:Ig-like domain-containing protein n=1 Tax=Shewanella zhuhaiensis TaxID=2919576 RepID=A0AAJ1BF04_9GAMM|nr:Ig-like domain-containing protein [Shewanella zhuhaiensis]MCH4293506.1 Ig-like domain-containing protein [Shewanella zhuhaiensis]
MKRLLTMALVVGLCSSHSLFAASLTKQSVNFSGSAKDIGVVNDVDNLVFLQAINPSKPGFITQGNGEWGFATNDGSNTPDVTAIAMQFNGAPALLGIPAESGTLTIGANNEIADLWTQRVYARPVVFVSFEDPNLNNGVSIVPTAPITHGNQFLFDVRQTDSFAADLTGAKVHYLVAEEGWHRLADGRMLLISSAEVKHTGFSGKTIELGASFTDAVTVAQLQRPMLFKNSLGFRQLFNMEVYQGATVTSGVGDFDSIGLRLMQQNGVEATTSDTVYAGRIGFMVLGNLTALENDFHYVEDTNTNIRGGSYLTVPLANFRNFPHSAATSPLFNKAACAEDDDVQNFCAYLSMPVDMFSRSTFETPRIPYVNANYDPLQMERTLYSEFEGWDWEKVLEADIVHPTVDSSGAAITGALAQMHPNFVADRGWDHVIFGSDSHWHWFALYHFNSCTFDSVRTACTDYLPGQGIIDNDDLQWDASIAYQYLIDYSGWGHLPEVDLAQEIFVNHDFALRDSNFFAESLTAPKWASEQTVEYLYQDSLPTEDYGWNTGYYGRNSLFYNAFNSGPTAQTWMLHATNLMAYATEFWCDTCDGPIPEEVVEFFKLPLGDKGNFETINKAMIRVPSLVSEWEGWRDIGFKLWVKPFVSPLTKQLRDGDYLFANVIWAADATHFRWVRSATGTIDDAITIATDVFGYQAQHADGNNYVTMCMTYLDIERCGDWHYVGKLPYVTDVHIKTEQGVQAPIVGRPLIGNYTYFAPGSGNYDVESHSLYQWQYRVDGQWLDLSGSTAKEQMLIENIVGGTEVRFCITPRTLENVHGFEVCSPVVTVQADFDADGIGDSRDNDDDNDGKYDWEDAFPKDASEYLDTDGDGIGNNADTDDDNDGLSDDDEITLGSDPLNADTDGDGLVDSIDPRPTIYGDLPDFDNDGIADELDTDRDNDGVLDFLYAVENKPGLQTSLETGDVVVATFRWDDNPYQACTAHSITVTSNADSGPGTLRQAMADLCASDPYGDLNKISFNGAMTIQLESPLVITKGMQIDGNREVVIDGQNANTIFAAAITDRMLNTQFPHLKGLTLRNGAGQAYNAATNLNIETELDMQRQASAIHVRSSMFLNLDYVLIENMTAPAISGNNVQLYLENSLIANVSGLAPALVTASGQIALFSSTVYNSEGGVMSVGSTGSAQLRNSLLLKGPNGSTVCNVDTWEQQTASWVEDSECGITSTGYVELADPENGDYRPVPGSANIEAAETGELPADAVDLLGNARVMGPYNPDNPVEDGGPIYPQMDIGAIEYVYAGDFDGDGVADSEDAFPNDATETADSDSDGVGDNSDAFPNDPDEQLDTDLDGIGNNADEDDDGDNVADTDDAFPLDGTEWLDTDLDGIGNNADTDDDNDGVLDVNDALPLDPTETLDTDKDGIGNNADTDDDGDGVLDGDDAFPLDATEWLDADLDGIGNNADPDDDNDGVQDGNDAFPFDPAEALDTDLDGIGNNADTDDDNDGFADTDDAFPLDATEWLDTDGDGIGNNADPDDDNDGIADEDDPAPLDPNVGDTQKPVFAELTPLTFEASGAMTAVTLPEPVVSDNISVASISSDAATELALGEHVITWTATDGAGNTATAEQVVTIVDTTAPEFDALETLELNASGRLTDINPMLDYVAFDLVDGDVTAELVGSSELPSGAHQLELVATDSSGNSGTTELAVHILPQLKLTKRMTVEAGGSYAMPLQLTGDAPVYPVTIAYSLLVDGQAQANQSANIASGTEGELAISIPAGLSVNTALQVQIDSVSHAFVADANLATLVLTEQNLAPTFSADVQQQGVATRLLDPLSGEAQIVLAISDVNINDTHQVSWQVVGLAFSGTVATDGVTMSFNPGELSSGRYAVDITVTESNTAELLSTKRRIRFKVDALPDLSSTLDTDGDGIVDSLEGYGDSDGDGIADYLDNDVDGSRLPVNSSTEPMHTTAGVQLSLGNTASAMISSGAGLTMAELADSFADDSSAADSSDSHFSQATAVLDFTLSGAIQPGQSVGVVIPLPSGTTLPADAVYRKYTAEQGWYTFVEDSANSISSAQLNAAGECPQVEDASYEQGLVEGYQCVQLQLEDGGPNDADGIANGVIEDPGVIAVLSQNQLPLAVADSAETTDTQAIIINVLANDSDADGDSLTVTAAATENGVVEVLADNTLRYTPAVGFSGMATISYQIADGYGGEAAGEVSVTVSLTPVVVEPETPEPKSSGGSLPLWAVLLLSLTALRRQRRA